MQHRFAYLVTAASLLLACQRTSTHDSPAPSASASSSPAPITSLAERDVDGEAAFDIVVITDGAALAWGAPKSAGIEVDVALLDGRGEPRGEPVVVGPATKRNVVEVSAASVAGRMAVAWLDRAGDSGSTWGALGDPATRSFGAPSSLGDASVGDASQRGHLAVAASDRAELMVLERGRDEACEQERGHTCGTFDFRELLSTGPERRGLPLSVPALCGRGLAGFALVKGRWHYAVCSELDGRPATTVFNIQRSPFYAEAKKVLEGCRPLGATTVGEDMIVVGDCPDGRRAVRFAGMSTAPRTLDLATSTLACERGRPVLRARGDAPFELVLDVARDGLAPLLPLAFAPANARAVWTGSSLLVASWKRQKLVLRRYECRGEELARSG